MVSHVRGTAYDVSSSGGNGQPLLPPGGIDHRGDRQPEYRQKSVDHFVQRWNGLVSRLDRMGGEHAMAVRDEILREALAALKDWRRTPPIAGKDPDEGSFEWKCRVANDPRPSRVVAGQYGVSHVTVIRYRRQYAGVRAPH